MRSSADHILTSHAGSLPRPDELIEANRAREAGDASDEHLFQQKLRAAVSDVVRHQRDLGIDIPGDGEFSKSMGHRVNYGAWRSYSFSRLGGLDLSAPSPYDSTPRRSHPGRVVLTNFADRRDRARFAAAYADPDSGTLMGHRPVAPTCVGPLTYIGHKAIKADIANFKAALTAARIAEGFMTSVGPASCARIGNAYYKTDEEFIYACANAMREEYKAILDAGLVLQLDDPAIAENWDLINPEPSLEDYKKFTMVRVEALNHAVCRKTASAFICAGAAGTARTRPTFRYATSSKSCWRSTLLPIRSRPAMSGTSTSGRCGRTSNCLTAS
jgi:5-methyltetrahydropteroyltriglutamate--homocysteine methyltransferase